MKASTVHVYCDLPVKAQIQTLSTEGKFAFRCADNGLEGVTFISISREELEGFAATITSFFEDCDRTAAEDDAMRLAEAQRQAAKYMGEDGDGGNPDDRPEEA